MHISTTTNLSPLTNTLVVLVEIYAKLGWITILLEDCHRWLCLKRKKRKQTIYVVCMKLPIRSP